MAEQGRVAAEDQEKANDTLLKANVKLAEDNAKFAEEETRQALAERDRFEKFNNEYFLAGIAIQDGNDWEIRLSPKSMQKVIAHAADHARQ